MQVPSLIHAIMTGGFLNEMGHTAVVLDRPGLGDRGDLAGRSGVGLNPTPSKAENPLRGFLISGSRRL
jgi:hypothetical protein